MSEPVFPRFYRMLFTIGDPILTVIAISGNLLAPEAILASYTPEYTTPIARETTFLLQWSAGFLCYALLMQLYLLRVRPNDLAVWRAVQGGTAIVDVFILVGLPYILYHEGRLGIGSWTSGDWINLTITPAVFSVRSAFLCGLGFDTTTRKAQ